MTTSTSVLQDRKAIAEKLYGYNAYIEKLWIPDPSAPYEGAVKWNEEAALTIADAILSLTPSGAEPLSPVLVQLVQTRCVQPERIRYDGSEAKSGWRDIETLPEDGSKFDALCVRHDGSRLPVRFTDVSMRGDGSGFGFIQHTKTGPVWHYLEQEDEVFPAWKIWKWMPLPASPTEGDVA